MQALPDRPPMLRFLLLFGAMLTLALALAALSPEGGPAERAVQSSPNGAHEDANGTRAPRALPAAH